MFARSMILAVLVSVVMASCMSRHSGVDDVGKDGRLASLDRFIDGSWELRVDRAWGGVSGDTAFPSDSLIDADYQPASPGPTYFIVVSDQASRVSVGSPPLDGQRTAAGGESIVYDLTGGTFAGRLAPKP